MKVTNFGNELSNNSGKCICKLFLHTYRMRIVVLLVLLAYCDMVFFWMFNSAKVWFWVRKASVGSSICEHIASNLFQNAHSYSQNHYFYHVTFWNQFGVVCFNGFTWRKRISCISFFTSYWCHLLIIVVDFLWNSDDIFLRCAKNRTTYLLIWKLDDH